MLCSVVKSIELNENSDEQALLWHEFCDNFNEHITEIDDPLYNLIRYSVC